MADFWVSGIVAQRDKRPYIQLSNEKGMIAQLSLGEARAIALDILVMSARTEMDATFVAFLEQQLAVGPEAASAMMSFFRDYRSEVDAEKVERSGGSDGEGGRNAT